MAAIYVQQRQLKGADAGTNSEYELQRLRRID